LATLGNHDTAPEVRGATVRELAVSVIIPALNEEQTIGKCLQAFCELDVSCDDFEVILVDNGSSDRTLAVARLFSRRLNLQILQRPGIYISGLRNWGARHANGKVLAFLDADCVPPRSWIRMFLSHLSSCGDGCVIGAHYKVPQPASWVASAWYGGIEAEKTGDVSYVPGGDLIVTHTDFVALGGFDESIQTNEDSEFCRRARSRGWKVLAFPDVAVEHLGTPQTVASFYRKQRWQGTHVFKVFLREHGLHNTKPVALAIYTLVAGMGIVAGLVLAITAGNYYLLALSVFALLAAPIAAGLRSSIKRNRLADTAPLAVLTLVYAVARCRCLLDVRHWMWSRKVS
jgi:glycosyltransferase involved in cell wall biosynthesis